MGNTQDSRELHDKIAEAQAKIDVSYFIACSFMYNTCTLCVV